MTRWFPHLLLLTLLCRPLDGFTADRPAAIDTSATVLAGHELLPVALPFDELAPGWELPWQTRGQEILHRIAGDDTVAFFGFAPELRFIRSPALYASASATGTVYVTSGMLQQIRTQSELAFVLFHEMAHLLLDHHGGSIRTSNGTFEELEADRLAFRLVREAGYDSTECLRFLTRISDLGQDHGLSYAQLFPTLSPRIRALSTSTLALR